MCMFIFMYVCVCLGWGGGGGIERLLNSYLVKLYFPASSVRNGSEQHLLLTVDVGDQYAAHTVLELIC